MQPISVSCITETVFYKINFEFTFIWIFEIKNYLPNTIIQVLELSRANCKIIAFHAAKFTSITIMNSQNVIGKVKHRLF